MLIKCHSSFFLSFFLSVWGNTVNVASRMESTGKAGAIQVTEETCQILQQFDYTFEQRGLVAVKGKGQLLTFYLQVRCGNISVAILLSLMILLRAFRLQGKGNKRVVDSATNSPAPAIRADATEGVVKVSDSLLATDSSPATGQRSVTVSSCSNSPSSVRVNQVYVEKLLATKKRAEDDDEDGKEATNSEDDIDMLDAKTPLLREKNSTIIVEGNGGSSSNSNNHNISSNNRAE